MLLLHNLINGFVLRHPDDVIEPLTKDDILAELNKADEKETEVEDTEDVEDEQDDVEDKEEKEDDEEEDDLEDLEEELKDEKDKDEEDEDLELIHPVSRKAILKEFPEIFKKFPYLEKAYFREQQFTAVFPTPKDAKEAQDKANTLDMFDKDMSSGNIEPMLRAIKATSGSTFNKVADEYLTTLAKVDNDAFLHVVGNVIKETILGMARKAHAKNDKNLDAAAAILNEYVFGETEFIAPSKLFKEEDNKPNVKEQELQQKQEALDKKEYDRAKTTIDGRVKNAIKSTIEKHIDPRNTMPEYVKKNAIRDATEMLEDQMNRSPRYKALVEKAWSKARKEGYSDESVERVRRIHITHAKTLLDAVIKKSRNEALKGIGSRAKVIDDDKEDKVKSKSSTPTERRPTNKKDIPPGMSSYDAWNLVEKG